MSEAFLKSLKWYMLSIFIIIGAASFIISSNTGSIKPVMVGIIGFGFAYIMSFFWTEFREKVLFLSVITFFGLSFFAPNAPDAIYILFGSHAGYAINPYYLWAATVGVLGVPIMSVVFYFYD